MGSTRWQIGSLQVRGLKLIAQHDKLQSPLEGVSPGIVMNSLKAVRNGAKRVARRLCLEKTSRHTGQALKPYPEPIKKNNCKKLVGVSRVTPMHFANHPPFLAPDSSLMHCKLKGCPNHNPKCNSGRGLKGSNQKVVRSNSVTTSLHRQKETSLSDKLYCARVGGGPPAEPRHEVFP